MELNIFENIVDYSGLYIFIAHFADALSFVYVQNVALAYRIGWTEENIINAYNLQSKHTVVKTNR